TENAHGTVREIELRPLTCVGAQALDGTFGLRSEYMPARHAQGSYRECAGFARERRVLKTGRVRRDCRRTHPRGLPRGRAGDQARCRRSRSATSPRARFAPGCVTPRTWTRCP